MLEKENDNSREEMIAQLTLSLRKCQAMKIDLDGDKVNRVMQYALMMRDWLELPYAEKYYALEKLACNGGMAI